MLQTLTTKGKSARIIEEKDFSIHLYDTLIGHENDWDEVLEGSNVLLSSNFLKAIQEYPPIGMQFRYIILKTKQDEAFGLLYYQLQYFNAAQSLSEKENKNSPCFFNTIQKFLKGLVAKQVEFNTFVCGNLLLTGENGFYFKKGSFAEENLFKIISTTSERVQEDLNYSGIQCNVCLMKDYLIEIKELGAALTEKYYHEFCIQPCMMMKLNPSWKSFDDYLDALQSKYRIRAKRAIKKSHHVEKRELSLEEIKEFQAEIYQLYLGVAENAGFNTVNLDAGYFYGLKKHLGDRFHLFAYFNNEKMVGFYTIIGNNEEAEAHFLGYDKQENAHSQLYLNTLYDIIDFSIQSGFKRINFSRTALEIKSSVGAVPQEMICYMKHRNKFSNKFLRPILDYLNPTVDWKQRHPFK